MTEAIERALKLDSSPEEVWRALTDPSELSEWLGDRTELQPEKGAEGWFIWENHGRYAVRIEEFEPMRRFSWRWARDPDTPLEGGVSTLVEWTLVPRQDGGTTLYLKESGFVRDEDREANAGGWKQELQELQDHLAST